jgi:hypothetical protein
MTLMVLDLKTGKLVTIASSAQHADITRLPTASLGLRHHRWWRELGFGLHFVPLPFEEQKPESRGLARGLTANRPVPSGLA